jgi:preprotein translocase subunit YajC
MFSMIYSGLALVAAVALFIIWKVTAIRRQQRRRSKRHGQHLKIDLLKPKPAGEAEVLNVQS